MTMQIAMNIHVLSGETQEAAATRAVKEEYGESASATIVEWPGLGFETETGVAYFDVLLEAEGISEDSDSIPEDAVFITRDVHVRPGETKEEAVTRTVKEEFGESASATIVEWAAFGIEVVEGGSVHFGAELAVVGVPEDVTEG
ncbi:hypothetical protein [Actinomadura violacea]|uniref:Uncharacterized protein n=1 Tax=Actinomadura violacea TaxID=2819934 RepID=A0ABS3RW64_9ACTN|nr:hypothetical protein [Actinomadura violacea]MBO2460538.1 hypothetical protein [Actinomadura violacea]